MWWFHTQPQRRQRVDGISGLTACVRSFIPLLYLMDRVCQGIFRRESRKRLHARGVAPQHTRLSKARWPRLPRTALHGVGVWLIALPPQQCRPQSLRPRVHAPAPDAFGGWHWTQAPCHRRPCGLVSEASVMACLPSPCGARSKVPCLSTPAPSSITRYTPSSVSVGSVVELVIIAPAP